MKNLIFLVKIPHLISRVVAGHFEGSVRDRGITRLKRYYILIH